MLAMLGILNVCGVALQASNMFTASLLFVNRSILVSVGPKHTIAFNMNVMAVMTSVHL